MRVLVALALVAAAFSKPSDLVQPGTYYGIQTDNSLHCYRLTFGSNDQIHQDYENTGACQASGFSSMVSLGSYSSYTGDTEYFEGGTFDGGCATSDRRRRSQLTIVQTSSSTSRVSVMEPTACTYHITFYLPVQYWGTAAPTDAPTGTPTANPTAAPTPEAPEVDVYVLGDEVWRCGTVCFKYSGANSFEVAPKSTPWATDAVLQNVGSNFTTTAGVWTVEASHLVLSKGSKNLEFTHGCACAN